MLFVGIIIQINIYYTLLMSCVLIILEYNFFNNMYINTWNIKEKKRKNI